MVSPLTLLPSEKSSGQGEASGTLGHLWQVAGPLSWPGEICVLGWNSWYFFVCADGSRGAWLPLCGLGTWPQPPPGLLCSLVPVQMTPGRRDDGILSYCLASPGLWECLWLATVSGVVWVALSGHSHSSPALSPFLHYSLFPSHPLLHTLRLPLAWTPGEACVIVHQAFGASILQVLFQRKMETQSFQLHNRNLEVFRVGFITASNAPLQSSCEPTGTAIP